MSSDERPQTGMRLVFWIWTVLVVFGLAVMIALPIAGR